jgi:sec-independent protein translocase protein TatC
MTRKHETRSVSTLPASLRSATRQCRSVTALLVSLTEPQLRAVALFVLTLVAVALVAFFLYRKQTRPSSAEHEMTFLEHLEELRTRILRVGLLVVLWVTVFISMRLERTMVGTVPIPTPVPSLFDTISARVFGWVVVHTVPGNVRVVTLSATEAVSAQIQVAFVLAVIVTFPFLLYETWAFFAPGLAPNERRSLRRTIPAAVLLFGLGAFFGFRFVVPLLFDVLYGFAAPLGAEAFLSAGTLVGMVTTLVLLFGFAFELPLVMAALVRLRIVEPQSYLRKWRHATVAIFVVAALASDPTLTSQLIIGTLLLVLYWGGVGLSFLIQPPAVSSNGAASAERLL